MSWRLLSGIVCAVGIAAFAGEAEPAPEPEPGRRLYEIYCGNCHGELGRGDGVTAEVMRIRPSDLTYLALGNDGEFPFERTRRIIDGRERVKGHGATGMPIWGLQFQDPGSDRYQGDEVNDRILDLTEYLRTLQRRAP